MKSIFASCLAVAVLAGASGCEKVPKLHIPLADKACIGFLGVKDVKRYDYHHQVFRHYVGGHEILEVKCNDGTTITYEISH